MLVWHSKERQVRRLKASGTMSRSRDKTPHYNKGSFFDSKTDDAKHDELVDRAYMKRQKKAKDKLARLRMIKSIGEKK
jgi:hypothetical protein